MSLTKIQAEAIREDERLAFIKELKKEASKLDHYPRHIITNFLEKIEKR